MDEKKKKKTVAQISEVTCTATKGHMCAVESKKGQKEERKERHGGRMVLRRGCERLREFLLKII